MKMKAGKGPGGEDRTCMGQAIAKDRNDGNVCEVVWGGHRRRLFLNKVGGGRCVKRQNTEDLGDSERTVCDTVVTDACHYVFVQTHSAHNS